jgi:hypothetical protein
MPRRFLLLLSAGLVSASGCTQTASVPPTPSIIGPTVAPTLQAAATAGCSGEIARYRAVMANDLATGHVNKAVHARISAEIDQASAACAAGRDADAVRMVNAAKARYGYR